MSKWINYFFIPICSAILTVILGTLISLITGYVSNNAHLIVKLFVWIVNIAISYLLSVLFFKKCKEVKFLNKISIFLSILYSECLVIIISGDLECSYLTVLVAILGIWGYFEKALDKKKAD